MDKDSSKDEQQAPFLEVPLSTEEVTNGKSESNSANRQSEFSSSVVTNQTSGGVRPLNYSDHRRSTLMEQKKFTSNQQSEYINTGSPEVVAEETQEEDKVSRKSSKKIVA